MPVSRWCEIYIAQKSNFFWLALVHNHIPTVESVHSARSMLYTFFNDSPFLGNKGDNNKFGNNKSGFFNEKESNIHIIMPLLDILGINDVSDLKPNFHDSHLKCALEFPKSVSHEKMKEFAQTFAVAGLECKIEAPYEMMFISSGWRLQIMKSKQELEEWIDNLATQNFKYSSGLEF